MTHSGQVFSILMVFIKIIGVIFVLHVFLLIFQYCIAALFVQRNPFKLLTRMLPAYFTALGTQSSAATIMLGITMIAAPGVPGGAIMASLGILQSMLGFDESAQALMIALYIAMDSFGTACNVTGDGAIALIIDKIMGKEKK